MQPQATDELTACVMEAAKELKQAIDGLTVVAPQCAIGDRIATLLALQRATRLLKSKTLKRRAIMKPS